MNRRIDLLVALTAIFFSSATLSLPIVHTSDFIADSTRTHFDSFESIPNDGTLYTGGAGPYVEDSVEVRQIDGDAGNDIWVTYDPGGRDGSFAWYPNGGDTGYTSISLAGGGNFGDVGMLVGSGNGSFVILHYELWNDGVMILAGSIPQQVSFHYLGFEGGGFDTIYLRDGVVAGSLGDGTFNALVVDAIEGRTLSVPEPGTLGVVALGLVAALLPYSRSRGRNGRCAPATRGARWANTPIRRLTQVTIA